MVRRSEEDEEMVELMRIDEVEEEELEKSPTKLDPDRRRGLNSFSNPFKESNITRDKFEIRFALCLCKYMLCPTILILALIVFSEKKSAERENAICDGWLTNNESAMNTFAIRVADFKSDGQGEIIVGNFDNFNQLLSRDALLNATELPGGTSDTQSIAVADFNNDGHDDMIFGNYGESNQLLLNDGNGTFPSAIELPVGFNWTRALGVADFNNDGYPDFIMGNQYEPNQLLINDRNGTFLNPVDLPGGNMNTHAIAIADINNDGHPDIVIGCPAASSKHSHIHGNDDSNSEKMPMGYNHLLLNDGTGAFPNAIDLPGGAMQTWAIAVADIDKDGYDDIVIGNREDQTNKLLINDGKGAFPTAIDLPGGAMSTLAIALGDLNNDSYPDIVVGNGDSHSVQHNQILINNRDGTFQDPISLPCSGDAYTLDIAVSDVDDDGFLDIIVGNRYQKNQVLINLGGGVSFKQKVLPF